MRFTMSQMQQLAALQSRAHMAELHFDETIYPQDTNSKHLFGKITAWLDVIRDNTKSSRSSLIVSKELQDTLTRTIYGSNRIEYAGLGWRATQFFCRQVFEDENNVDWIYEQHDEALQQQVLAKVLEFQPSSESRPRNVLLRARNEISQHAKAYQHILHYFIDRGEDLSEDLIKETHRILTQGVLLENYGNGSSSGRFIDAEYGGLYRNVIVTAGTTCFAHPKAIPGLMAALCQDIKSDIRKVEETNRVDPFSLAAKHSMEFVQIHPFRDGNGRMCRIILNAILCRFAGIFCPMGESDEDIKTYIGIKRREGETLHGHGEYAQFVLEKAHTRVREMKKKLCGARDR